MLPPIAQLVEQLALNETVPGSNPGGRTRYKKNNAQVAKLVDALVLGTSREICGGSSPLLGTILIKNIAKYVFYFVLKRFIVFPKPYT